MEHEAANRRICVWFGEHKIVEHVSEPPYAEQFEAAMRRRFASLRARAGSAMGFPYLFFF